jgi:CRISPR-associated endonuclease Cas2
MKYKQQKKTDKGVVTRIALGLLAVGGAVVLLAAAPGLSMALKLIDPNPRKAMRKLERALSALAKQGDVTLQPGKQGKRYRITSMGRKKLARLQLARFTLTKRKKWNGKWQVVCFDIPETEKYERTLLQTKLTELGFYRLQNSVFVSPFESSELVQLAHQVFDSRKYVRLIVADTIDNEAYLRQFFHLSK